MDLHFSWDPAKAAANLKKHGVSFEDAKTAFADPRSITIPDPDHSASEQRYILVGVTAGELLVVVAHVERTDTIRLISARRATRRERRLYEEDL